MSTGSHGQDISVGVENQASGRNLSTSHSISSHNAPHDLFGYRPSSQPSRPTDLRTIQRQPTPSPLQISAWTADSQTNHQSNEHRSPTISRAEDTLQYSPPSPASPASGFATDPDQPKSPVDRLDQLLATERLVTREGTDVPGETDVVQSSSAAPLKAQSYGQRRNVPSPFPQSKSLGNSPPRSPTSTTSSRFTNTTIRPSPKSMPRTSSIDSAISSISTTTSHSHQSSQDSFNSNPADILHLINTAGSPEAVIQYLLKEKKHSAAQNAKLWKLLDKQRALILGLNRDLEQALKDKEHFRKKLKDQLAPIPRIPGETHLSDPRVASQSPTPSDVNDERPGRGTTLQNNNLHRLQNIEGSSERESPAGQTPNLDKPAGTVPQLLAKASTSTIKQASRADADVPGNPPLNQENTADINNSIRAMAPLIKRLDTPNHKSKSANTVVSPSSFTAKRLQPWQNSSMGSPPQPVVASPPGTTQETFLPRKLPPAPLDLRVPGREIVPQPQYGPDDHSSSEYEDNAIADEEIPSIKRGRKKTREEDDRERETAALKEQQDRSRSKKEKGSKTPSEVKDGETKLPVSLPTAPMLPTVKAFSPEHRPSGGMSYLAAPNSLAGVLTPTTTQPHGQIHRSVLSVQPLSPGLPMSPRPGDRPLNSPMPRMPREGAGNSLTSPPLSPPAGFVGLPLSPRAPKQSIPFPPNTPMSIASPKPPVTQPLKEPVDASQMVDASVEQQRDQPNQGITRSEPQTLATSSPDPPSPRKVYKGFISDAYPGLLIPPNALPSISIKVISSLLKPSRNSYLVSKGAEEEPVFILRVASRSDNQGLWQVEKSLLSLPHLDHQLKQFSAFGARLPDRSLFHGQAPAKIDARKIALERYFETILDTPMDEKAALVLCTYLSTQVLEPSAYDVSGGASTSGSPVTPGSDGKPTKEGYLTKRGKNFGGWKSRFFVLDDPVLRYYESPSGNLLGTIKLHNAQIGKPSSHHHSNSPSRGSDEGDSQYRHALLILEPKRKDSTSHVRHILCAESDTERDAWVEALFSYVDGYQRDENVKKPSLSSNESGSGKVSGPLKKSSLKSDGSVGDSPQSEAFDGLQTVSYDNTVAAQPPTVHMMPDHRFSESPTPPENDLHPQAGTQKYQTPMTISGPSNGARIQDVGAWGNKPLTISQIKDKEHKKRSIWGFREKHPSDLATNHSNESSLSLAQQHYYDRTTSVRPVFGMQLSEAVEHCPPRGVDICLPAVVYRCLEYLEAKDALSEEGIFRLSGSSIVIKGLRDRFNVEGDFDFLVDEQYHDVHAVASLLKLYLRELPASVLTRELHLNFIQVLTDHIEESKKIEAFKVLVQKLPKPNWTLIRALSEFLIGIVNNSKVNKMSIRNVGIVFSPTLKIPPPVFSMFLTDFESIFGDEYKEEPTATFELSISEPLTPEDIRSPRHQILSDIPTPSYHQATFPKQESSYEQKMHTSRIEHDIGFIPLQPSYEPPSSRVPSYDQPSRNSIVPGPEYNATSRKPNANSAAKARRRESSMLMMGSGPNKSSMPGSSGDSDMVHEESAFQ